MNIYRGKASYFNYWKRFKFINFQIPSTIRTLLLTTHRAINPTHTFRKEWDLKIWISRSQYIRVGDSRSVGWKTWGHFRLNPVRSSTSVGFSRSRQDCHRSPCTLPFNSSSPCSSHQQRRLSPYWLTTPQLSQAATMSEDPVEEVGSPAITT